MAVGRNVESWTPNLDGRNGPLYRELAEAGDGPAFVEADHRFHRVFVAAAGNAILLSLHDSLRDRQNRMGLAAIARDPRRTREIIAEHEELAAAVTARHPSQALEIIDRHLDGTLQLLLPASLANTGRLVL